MMIWLFSSSIAQYLQTYLFNPFVWHKHWIFCIERHAAYVFPSTGEMFLSSFGFVGGIWRVEWKKLVIAFEW